MLDHKRGARRITLALCLTPKDPKACILDSSTAFIVDCIDHVIAYKRHIFHLFPKISCLSGTLNVYAEIQV